MGDEIQITVIATGFEKEEDRKVGYDNIVSDAWRRGRQATAPVNNTPSAPSNEDSSNLDIPAFLRRNKGLNK